MSTKDIIKKSILEGFQSEVSVSEIAIVLAITLCIGFYIFAVYRICSKNSFYSKDFNKTLVLLALITAGIVLAMQSNLIISLGMVGALSIVRFRNAIKDPMDLVFLFWAISVGIICGAGLYVAAVVLSVFVTIAILVLDVIPDKSGRKLLVINSDSTEAMGSIVGIVKTYTKNYKVKSRNMTKRGLDVVLEVSCKDEDALMNELLKKEEIISASLLDYSGEVRA